MTQDLTQVIASIEARAAAATIDTSISELYNIVILATEAGGGSKVYDSAGDFPLADSAYYGSTLWSGANNSLYYCSSTHGSWINITAIPPNQILYTAPGQYTLTIPEGVYYISALAIGGGGAGDNGNSGNGGGGGGAGGACAYANNVPVTPGETMTIVVGAGGAADEVFSSKAQDGENSTVTYGTFVMTGSGGGGGAPYTANPGGVAYDPIFVNVPVGTVTGGYAGGGGGAASTNGGGGGGGAGGVGGVGGNGGSATTATGLLYTSGFDGAGLGAGGGGAGHNLTGGLGNSGGGNGGNGTLDKTGGGGGGAYVFGQLPVLTRINGQPGNGVNVGFSKGGDGGYPGGGGGGSYDNSNGNDALGGDGCVRLVLGRYRTYPNNAEDI